jgi:hypothetical protein
LCARKKDIWKTHRLPKEKFYLVKDIAQGQRSRTVYIWLVYIYALKEDDAFVVKCYAIVRIQNQADRRLRVNSAIY